MPRRVVNRFWKRSLNDRFLFRFSIAFKNDRFVFGTKRSFLKTTHSFWNFKRLITIVFENYRYFKNDLRPFFIRLFFKNDFLWKTIVFKKTILLTIMSRMVNEGSSLTIINEGFSLTIVNETTSFIKTVVFEKKISCNCIECLKFKSCGEAKTSWYFLKNYSMISTDALQVGFLYLLTIVNEGIVVNDR